MKYPQEQVQTNRNEQIWVFHLTNNKPNYIQMKNLLKLISSLLLCFAACFSQAQPQWKFHLAFEDATGAKDTIWYVWDTTANTNYPDDPVDYHLGEGRIEMDMNAFNVWKYNTNLDSTKTWAVPYSSMSMTNQIYAFNYQLPITLRWDSTLFNAPFLPPPTYRVTEATLGNDFIFFNNSGLNGLFNMLMNDRIKLPEYDVDHFPLDVSIDRSVKTDITKIENNVKLQLSPNPSTDYINLEFKPANDPIQGVIIYNASGQLVLNLSNLPFENPANIDVNTLSNGIYFIQIKTLKTQYHEKFIKTN